MKRKFNCTLLPTVLILLLVPYGFVLTTAEKEKRNQSIIDNVIATRECVLKELPEIRCRGNKYRSIDGKCNNPVNVFAGAAHLPFKRLLPPSYGDGKKSFRKSVNGEELPPARLVSNLFSGSSHHAFSKTINGMFVLFGQYLTHDLTRTAIIEEENGTMVNCSCNESSPSCINLSIPSNDRYYNPEEECISVYGSTTSAGCEEHPNEQVNSVTSCVDAGTIYGSSEEMMSVLRESNSDHGALRLVDGDFSQNVDEQTPGCPFHRNKQLLPTVNDIHPSIAKAFDCRPDFNSPPCFISGDDRVNNNIALSSIHLLFTREHNRIAKQLKTLNKHWDSDKVFEETRRLIIAIHQQITYGEFLPLLLGPKLMRDFDLELSENGFYYGYDATYDATISNEFATAAFRYGHSQVGGYYHQLSPGYDSMAGPSIRTFLALFRQQVVYSGNSPAIMRGLMTGAAKTTSPYFVEDLRNLMFASERVKGKDLFAINIQRGRAHGLASYNDVRVFCGLQRAQRWADLLDTMSNATIETLMSMYESIDDLDLYVGGLAERLLPQANVGPVFGCIIGHQFRDIKKGDKFWFENPGQFSIAQLQEMRKVTLSRIICDNMDGMEIVPPRALEIPRRFNTRVRCGQLPRLTLNNWEDFDPSHDGVWTRWFPSESKLKENLLRRMDAKYPEMVCLNPIEVQSSAIDESSDDRVKVRFLCPKGSIRASVFPNVKHSLNYYWTGWFDRDTPSQSGGDDVESLFHLRRERNDEICDKPLYMQAQTKSMESAFDSDEVFEVLSPAYGLICNGSDQVTGTCKDYRLRFYCPKEYREKVKYLRYELSHNPNHIWSNWINLSNPQQGDEDESLQNAREHANVCRNPLLIEGRIAISEVPALKSGDVLKKFSIYHGLICENKDQLHGRCKDYEVRYLCPMKNKTLEN